MSEYDIAVRDARIEQLEAEIASLRSEVAAKTADLEVAESRKSHVFRELHDRAERAERSLSDAMAGYNHASRERDEARSEVAAKTAESEGWKRAAENQARQWAKKCEEFTEARAEVERLMEVRCANHGRPVCTACADAMLAEVARLTAERAEAKALFEMAAAVRTECAAERDARALLPSPATGPREWTGDGFVVLSGSASSAPSPATGATDPCPTCQARAMDDAEDHDDGCPTAEGRTRAPTPKEDAATPGCRITNSDGTVIETRLACQSKCSQYAVGAACRPTTNDPCGGPWRAPSPVGSACEACGGDGMQAHPGCSGCLACDGPCNACGGSGRSTTKEK